MPNRLIWSGDIMLQGGSTNVNIIQNVVFIFQIPVRTNYERYQDKNLSKI